MKNMVGFRNIAVHDYKKINENVIIEVIENYLNELTEFIKSFL